MRTLVLGLGNELLADDGVGIAVARLLRSRLGGAAEVKTASVSGIALLEFFLDYDRAIIIDAVQTGKHRPGEFFDIDPKRLPPCIAPSPHYTGLPEMFDIARKLDLKFPRDVKIVAIEVEDITTVGGEMSTSVQIALPALTGYIEHLVRSPEPAQMAYAARPKLARPRR
ncbi:MAG TPA: hydrogenase maturation protease [Fimbriimonadaceae bacterium]|nr:hydrogenase maturation protease [Fimbriimonadaceae bacterium]